MSEWFFIISREKNEQKREVSLDNRDHNIFYFNGSFPSDSFVPIINANPGNGGHHGTVPNSEPQVKP